MLFLAVLLLGFAVGCGDDDDDGGNGDASPGSSAPVPRASPNQPEPKPEPKPKPRKPGECVEVAEPEPKADGGGQKPTEELTENRTVTFRTNCGAFTVEVDASRGLTAASFVELADSGFYDNTYFHRIAPGFVIQGGDPTGTGSGGPGYQTTDAPPDDATYPKYTVAMAKGPQEPAGTSGSQFFVMTGDLGLPPEYAIVGAVTRGQAVIDAIGKLGNAQEVPTRFVVVEKATASGG
jgi:cyclophilin family peptidyl-prolyl cis-trans isomerase